MTNHQEARAGDAGSYGSAGIWQGNRTPNSPSPKNPQASLCLAPAKECIHREPFDHTSPAEMHREIARRYAWKRKKNAKPLPRHVRILLARLRELELIFAVRYGAVLPDDDAGRDDAFIAAQHIRGLGGQIASHITAWLRMRCPWMAAGEAWELIERVIAKPYRWRPDSLAERQNITMAMRTALGLTTIGAIDCTAAERKELRRKRHAEAAEAKRRERGAKPHAESAERTKPWEAEGVSRATWHRRRQKARETDSCAPDSYVLGDESVSRCRKESSEHRVISIAEGHLAARPFQVECSRSC